MISRYCGIDDEGQMCTINLLADVRSEILATHEGFCVEDRNGTRHYIQLAGKNLHHFNEGWAPLFLYSGFQALHFLELRHKSGQQATWFLNEKLEFVGNSLQQLSPLFKEALRSGLRTIQADIWAQLMLSPTPSLQPATREFFSLNDLTSEEMLTTLPEPGTSDLAVFDLSVNAELTLQCDWADHSIVVQRTLLESIIRLPIKARFIEACATGKLSWPSPVDGEPMRLLGGLFLDDFRFAYRLVDDRSGLIVVLVVTEHLARTIAIFLPQVKLVVVSTPFDTELIRLHFGKLVNALERHLWRHAVALETYFQSKAFTIASVLRGGTSVHLGHQLWNELSPIEDVVRSLSPESQPLFLIPNAPEGIEVYGPLDALYPELEGHVLRFDGGAPSFASHAYGLQLCVTRITDIYVPAALRTRILSVASQSQAGRDARCVAEALSSAELPIILVGLRVENRTLVDLAGFLITLIEKLLARTGHATFVLDGHNRRLEGAPESMFQSHGEHAATRRPQDVEREIAAILQTHFAGTAARIISTIGAPMSTSLVWASHCHMFFAIWGAGLAKYRWVANKPGFVLSSAWNLRHRRDLRIYDAPQYMEGPTQVVFADPAYVSDRPDLRPLMLPRPEPQFTNFEVSVEAIWPQVEPMLAAIEGLSQ